MITWHKPFPTIWYSNVCLRCGGFLVIVNNRWQHYMRRGLNR